MSIYNFIGSWQLIPEQCKYSSGVPPKSMIVRFEQFDNKIRLDYNWFTHTDESYQSSFHFSKDDGKIEFDHKEMGHDIQCEYKNSHHIILSILKDDIQIAGYDITINNKGLLIINQEGKDESGNAYTREEIYHRQLAVLPYASSISGVAIRPTEQGVIKHKALQAMAEQTDMHLDQIKKQIELLAQQANEIKRRRDLSLKIYEAKINFVPQIGQVYHLYEKQDGVFTLSLIAPEEWGGGAGPYKEFHGSVKLLADHTWTEVG